MTQKDDLSKVEGLQEVLEILRVSSDFEARCGRAAAVAWQVRQLRKGRTETGFRATGFRKYVEVLARAVGLDGGALLEWFGIGDLGNAQESRQAARLARGIGLSLPELLAHLRIEFAERRNEPVAALCRSGGPGGQPESLESCEAALARIAWDMETAALLRRLEMAAAAEYGRL